MKEKDTKIGVGLIITLLIVYIVNVIINLTIYIVDNKITNLILAITYGIAFVAMGLAFIGILQQKLYVIATNGIYYRYHQNVIIDSTYLYTKHIHSKKIRTYTHQKEVEYRLIDNEYVKQKIGIVTLDKQKTLIIWNKPRIKERDSKKIYVMHLVDQQKNDEIWREYRGMPEIDEPYVYYTNDYSIAYSIQEENDKTFKVVKYEYTSPIIQGNIKRALQYDEAYWYIEDDTCLEQTYHSVEEAKLYIQSLIDINI